VAPGRIILLMTSTPVLLLGGAGLPAWIWDDVRAALAVESAAAPRPPAPDASLDDYARAALGAAPGERFVVVAHSSGSLPAGRQ
jgi:hypothetical protein